MLEYLPEAVVMEILFPLPLKTLVRLTAVCKSWNAMIKSHTFISSHSRRPLSHPFILIRHAHDDEHDDRYTLYSYPFYNFLRCQVAKFNYPFLVSHSGKFLCFVGTLNGVVCLSEGYTDIILWNPLIKRQFQLPVPLFTRETFAPYSYNLFLGFGFDSENNDFKVVRASYVLDLAPPKVDLYSLNEGSWRVVDASYVELNVHPCASQCFFNGNVHWIAYKGEPFCPSQYNCILMFDVEEEKFKEMDLPEKFRTSDAIKFDIFVTDGCLSLIDSPLIGLTTCDIWMNRNSSWCKTFSVNSRKPIYKVWGLPTIGEVLVLPKPICRGYDGLVSLYSFDHRTQKLTEILPLVYNRPWFHVSDFTPSLVLLDKKVIPFRTT